ncbi:MAG TPA: iron-sulfur cluster assembly accessory protein [Phycisphaerales bacterium]|nr:iron-sulfur cluster assembly accessory protein [Phycisphaerales bacterium]
MNMPVTVTERAAREIHRIILEQELDPEKVRLRVGVKGGGCSGFSYLLDLTETQKDTDEEWVTTYDMGTSTGTAKAVKVGGCGDGCGCGHSHEDAGHSHGETHGHMNGNGSATAVKEPQIGGQFSLKVICDPKSYLYLNGTNIDYKEEIMGRGFVFNNPNATSSCGCGSSFSA